MSPSEDTCLCPRYASLGTCQNNVINTPLCDECSMADCDLVGRGEMPASHKAASGAHWSGIIWSGPGDPRLPNRACENCRLRPHVGIAGGKLLCDECWDALAGRQPEDEPEATR